MDLKKLLEEYIKESESLLKLNPLLFEDEKLKSDVRDKVISIVSEFMKFSQSESVDIIDIRLVGSNAAYNYTPTSDLDVHIVVDLSKVSDPEIIGRLYFDSIKAQFKKSYDITIKGIEVEVYVEDINTTSISNGIYSVTLDTWVRKPTEIEELPDDVKQSAEDLADSIISSIESVNSLDSLQDIVDSIYVMRKDSLSSDGERGVGNLAFKILRNRGILQLLKDTLRDAKSKELSLEGRKISEGKDLDEALDKDYISYIDNHRAGVRKVFDEIMRPVLESEGVEESVLEEIDTLIENHDKSKYGDKEFRSYRDRFYKYKDHEELPSDVSEAFDIAWNHHQNCNPHHWNYWVLVNDVDEPQVRPVDMPLVYIVEMLCDWQSAGKFYGNSAKDWYEKNGEKMILSENTRKIVEKYISYLS